MEFRTLKYFLAIAREENISKAANILHITQPTLSRQLKELEDELGIILFVRGNRKITLTEDGMFLRKRAEEIVALAEKTEAEIKLPNHNLSGNIYIGGGESHTLHFIARILKDLQNDHPMIKVHLYSGNADLIIERLDKGLIDFGILIDPADINKYNYLKIPNHDQWGILMRKDAPFAKKQSINIQDMVDKPLICSSQTLIKGEISKWFGKNYDKLNIVATYNLLYNASILVEEGVGYALTLDKLINTTGDSSLCFVPFEPKIISNLNIVWKKYQIFSKTNQVFLDKLKESLND